MHRPVVCQLAKATPHGPTSAHISVVILLLVMLTTTSTTSVHTKSCPTCHQHVCEISASMSTPTQPWRLVSPEPCLHVLPFYARSVVSVAWCPSRFYSRWSFHWYWDTSTMAVQHWLDYLAISSTSYSRWCQYMTYMFGMQVRTHHAAALSATADWVLVFRCLHGTAPQYLACELYSVANNDSWWRLRSASMSALDVPPTCCVIIGDRAFGVLVCETAFRMTSLHRRHSPVSSSDWKRCCFNVHFTVISDCVTLTYFSLLSALEVFFDLQHYNNTRF